MKLYFEHNKQRREIGQPKSENEGIGMINKFLDEHNFKSHYTRMWEIPKGEKYYDVGSYTEFFVLVKE